MLTKCGKRLFSGVRSGKVTVVTGSQWGDEGKGKLVDVLASGHDIIARCNGGANAGHTIVDCHGNKYAMHQVPSGILQYETVNLIGHGTVLDVEGLFEELAALPTLTSKLLVSDKTPLVLPTHKLMDYWKEKSARTPIGTTQKGIGLAYADKALRDGLRVCDATDPVMFAEKVERLIYKHVELISAMHPHAGKPTSSAVREWCSKMVKLVSKLHEDGMVVDGINYLHRQLRDGKSVLVEGANGAMLDIDMGTYPFVTSSSTTIGGVLTGLGLNAGHIGEVIGVMKAYVTRVGGGPFPTELTDVEHGGLRIPGTSETWIGSHMQTTGKEIGVTTGRKRRCGWLDAVALSHAIRINGYTSLNATKGDVLDALPYIRVCVAYKMPDGTTTNEFPSTDCNPVPIYQTFKGWETSTVACRKFSDLPQNAQRYYLGLQTLTGLPIRWIGTGPSRNDMIML